MKAVFVSDTHFALLNKMIEIPDGDILFHSGDLDVYNEEQFNVFREWMRRLPHKYKIIVPGNHDLFWKNEKNGVIDYGDFILLIHDKIEVDQLSIFGSPFTPRFGNWAFMYDKEYQNYIWKDVPNNLDVLITHGPLYGILDYVKDGIFAGRNAGCRGLRQRVFDAKPKIHCFGHIHGGAGTTKEDGIYFINSSVVDDIYQYNGQQVTAEI